LIESEISVSITELVSTNFARGIFVAATAEWATSEVHAQDGDSRE
jgi:hypothetical protein